MEVRSATSYNLRWIRQECDTSKTDAQLKYFVVCLLKEKSTVFKKKKSKIHIKYLWHDTH